MTDIEKFMSGQDLKRCEALCANITQATCTQNKTYGRIFSCDNCSGLKEINEMAPQIKKPCIEPGCSTMSWKSGYCWKHHPEHIANKKASREDKAEIAKIHKAAIDPFEGIDAGKKSTPPVVAPVGDHCIDLVELFKAKQAADLKDFIDGLNEFSGDPLKKIEWAFRRVSTY